MMRTLKVSFPEQQALCVFPSERSDLAEATSELQLGDNSPVIVLIGDDIEEQQADVTRRAIQTISSLAEDTNAVVICGGTDMGVMAEIGQTRRQNHYKFPLVGVTLEKLVTWPGGPKSTNKLWWGTKRWELESHHSHFILVPGDQFGDESAWIVDIATILSNGNRSVTILINGGEVSQKAIELSLEHGRPVIVISRTGRLADKLAREPNRSKLIYVAPANADKRIIELIQTALSIDKKSMQTDLTINAA